MVTESINGKTETDLKVAGPTASNMAKVLIYLLTETSIWAITLTENQTNRESTSGKMALSIKVSLKKASSLDMVSGKKSKIRPNVIILKATISLTRRTVMASLLGKVATSTMGTIEMMRGTGTVRCIGQMGLSIRGSGSMGFSRERAA